MSLQQRKLSLLHKCFLNARATTLQSLLLSCP